MSKSSPPEAGNSSLEQSPKLLETPKKGQSAAKLLCAPMKNYEDKYMVMSDGRLFSLQTKRFLKPRVNKEGYLVYYLSVDERSIVVFAHLLVAEHFLINPAQDKYVIHKDGNILNNNFTNLAWVSEHGYEQIKQYQKVFAKNNKAKTYQESDSLPDEVWRIFRSNPIYSVSNMGRVKNNRTGRIMKQLKRTSSIVKLNDNKQYQVHRLVYAAFNNDYDLSSGQVIHIDGNRYNNQLSNLKKVEEGSTTIPSGEQD